MNLCFATNNPNKLIEVQNLLGSEFILKGLKDIGCEQDIPETGTSLEENSLIKAQFVSENFGIDCFADDTGLEVEALQGAPGVYSARYAGEPSASDANIDLLLENLKNHENRRARFRTVFTLIIGEETKQFEGQVRGVITDYRAGSSGFGYDPVFTPDGYDRTFAEMSLNEKNAISHRAIATTKLVQYLKSQFK